MKIYTKTGDRGSTALYGGVRVSKANLRVESYGTVDELSACIGFSKSLITNEICKEQLKKIQFDLFTLGSESATPFDKLILANGKNRLPEHITETEILELEHWIDDMEQHLQPLQYFILPGGGQAATSLHIARTVCRRAERCMVALTETEELRQELTQYLNRLSDYLFVLARFISKEHNEPEEYWIPKKR